MRRPTRDRDHGAGLHRRCPSPSRSAQRPGWATSDTKIDLHVDPVRFLGQVASVWTHSIDLGAVQGAQYGGYLWPMGPFFALLHGIGLEPVGRAAPLAGPALRAVGLGRAAADGRRSWAARAASPTWSAAAFYVLNPYTVIFTGRTSVALLGYAALPWLLLVVHHGVRGCASWRDWRGLVVGGGVRPDPHLDRRRDQRRGGGLDAGRAARAADLRAADRHGALARLGAASWCAWACSGLLASLWWIVPLSLHVQLRHRLPPVHRAAALDLGHEQRPRGAAADGATGPPTSASASSAPTGRCSARPARCCSTRWWWAPRCSCPALALAGFVWTPALALRAVPAARAARRGGDRGWPAFPTGHARREAMEWVYRNVPLRALHAHDAEGGAAGGDRGGRPARPRRRSWPGRACARCGAPRLRAAWRWWRRRLALAALIALAALPLVRGTAVEQQLTWKQHPQRPGPTSGADLDRELPRNCARAGAARARSSPTTRGAARSTRSCRGSPTARSPCATRRPYSRPARHRPALDRRPAGAAAAPAARASCVPLLRLMGVRRGGHRQRRRPLAQRRGRTPQSAAAELDGPGPRPARRAATARARALRAAGGRARRRRARLPAGAPLRRRRGGRGLVHVAPAEPGHDRRRRRRGPGRPGRLRRAAASARRSSTRATSRRAQLRALGRAAAPSVVVSDSNRRRRFVPEFGRSRTSAPRSPENEPLDENFAHHRARSPTAAATPRRWRCCEGAALPARARTRAACSSSPSTRAITAFDGDPSTVWTADRYLHPRDALDRDRLRAARATCPTWSSSRSATGAASRREVDVNGVRAKARPRA